ncbi:hypothetical protein AX14_008271, partial [Amanita brunnescens Koide BX004]
MNMFSWFTRKSSVANPAPFNDPSEAPIFDFTNTPLAQDYPPHHRYVKILDGVFTQHECNALVRFAETGVFDLCDADVSMSDENLWEQAAVHFGMEEHQKVVDTKYRNSDRILRFDDGVAQWIYERLRPYVHELAEIGPGSEWERVVGRPGGQEEWRMVGANERLSFLRYGPGHFFKEHCDGQVALPDGRQGRVTVQIYLGGDAAGGATRLWSRDMRRWLDVEPKAGRALVFQQRDVLHSGERVVSGVKLT